LIDGRAIAAELLDDLAAKVVRFVAAARDAPRLAAVLVGDHAASKVYVRNKRRACQRVGIDSQLHQLPAETDRHSLLQLIGRLNGDPSVHGILVQLPLPSGIGSQEILDAVDPRKDVDAFHPENVGRLVQGRPRFMPCTPHGVQQLLARSGIEVAGRRVAVVGRSDIVGKPLAVMLGQRDSPLGRQHANATVTLCHSATADLAAVTRESEVVIAAVGRPAFLTADMVRPGAVVVDVGINRTPAGLVGDVDFDAVRQVAGWITPVPGGVGPLTVAMLLHNTLAAARLQAASAA
jgi:methylenetetrahydrofolate dehydrogenase (NADP+)/methenyltetrahydrofolate cyclohydrolase